MSKLELFALDVLGPLNERVAKETAELLMADRAFFQGRYWQGVKVRVLS